jgi:hypothetical protein
VFVFGEDTLSIVPFFTLGVIEGFYVSKEIVSVGMLLYVVYMLATPSRGGEMKSYLFRVLEPENVE